MQYKLKVKMIEQQLAQKSKPAGLPRSGSTNKVALAAQTPSEPMNGHQITFSKNLPAQDIEVMSSTLQPNKKLNLFAADSASDSNNPVEEDSINLRQQIQYPSSYDTPSSKASTKAPRSKLVQQSPA